MLVIANQGTNRISRERSLSGARQPKKEGDVYEKKSGEG
jgi:hypothetical protein